MINDTIAAISTPIASAGIGIIRITGDEALDVLSKVFVASSVLDYKNLESHKMHYGHIVDKTFDRVLDEVLVSIMLAPKTYTREHVVEINTHGGLVVMQSVLSLILRNGARIAEPGEFTKRAFLNGRLDLSQAEAVMDVINAKTDLALNASVKQLSGTLKTEVDKMKQEILGIIAHIEASIDYPEYDIDELSTEKLVEQCTTIKDKMKRLIYSYDNGRIVREGIKTVIVGRPNVGKSSLLNALLKEQRAIVTDIPGTTRDSLEEYMNIHGIPLKLIDTAGIRDTEDVVEKIGVSKSKELIEKADLVLFVIDSSTPLTKEDDEIMDLIKAQKVIVLMNKSDLSMQVKKEHLNEHLREMAIIETSALNFQGLDELENQIKDMFLIGKVNLDNETMIHNIRHKNALLSSLDSLEKVIEAILIAMPEDLFVIDLHNCYESLGEVTGDTVTDDIITQIFSQFCLGK